MADHSESDVEGSSSILESIREQNTPLYEGPETPFVLADGYSGVTIANGVARFTLTQARGVIDNSTAERHVVRYVVGNLAVPITALESIHTAMGELIDQLKSDGSLPAGNQADNS